MFRRLAIQLITAASAPVGSGSQRNARAALQARYDAHRDDHEVLAVLGATPGRAEVDRGLKMLPGA